MGNAEDSIIAPLPCIERTLDIKNVISKNAKLKENKTSLFIIYVIAEMQNKTED